MKPLTIDQVRALPAMVDVVTAARALGLGRSKAYELAKADAFPCRIVKIGATYRVPTSDLLRVLETHNPHPHDPGAPRHTRYRTDCGRFHPRAQHQAPAAVSAAGHRGSHPTTSSILGILVSQCGFRPIGAILGARADHRSVTSV